MEIIRIDGLTKTYHNGRGVKELSLSIEEGSVFGLLGPNGSGKTTTMKVLTGLLQTQEGKVHIFGKELTENREEILAKTGSIIETPGVYSYLTAQENLDMLCRNYPVILKEWGEHILEELDIAQYRNEKVKTFSMGMKQRFAFAMALYTKPELLILDEPTNGMDISGTAIVRKMLQSYVDNGGTIFISSHLAAELEQICTHAGVMDGGVLLETAQVRKVMEEYGSLEQYYLAVVGAKKKGAVA